MEATAFTISAMPKMPESEKKITVSARVQPSVLDALERIANADDRKVAYVIEKAIREYVARNPPPKRSRDR
jgi:hypothetical protein